MVAVAEVVPRRATAAKPRCKCAAHLSSSGRLYPMTHINKLATEVAIKPDRPALSFITPYADGLSLN